MKKMIMIRKKIMIIINDFKFIFKFIFKNITNIINQNQIINKEFIKKKYLYKKIIINSFNIYFLNYLIYS